MARSSVAKPLAGRPAPCSETIHRVGALDAFQTTIKALAVGGGENFRSQLRGIGEEPASVLGLLIQFGRLAGELGLGERGGRRGGRDDREQ